VTHSGMPKNQARVPGKNGMLSFQEENSVQKLQGGQHQDQHSQNPILSCSSGSAQQALHLHVLASHNAPRHHRLPLHDMCSALT
jgi:hypothetical protein